MLLNDRIIDTVTAAYVEAAYFTDTGEGDQPEATDDMADCTRSEARETCAEFLRAANDAGLLDAYTSERRTWDAFGHDFWLTRNRHGAGFWDRGMDRLGDALTDLARTWGETGLYLGDDGRLYLY